MYRNRILCLDKAANKYSSESQFKVFFHANCTIIVFSQMLLIGHNTDSIKDELTGK